MITKPFSEIVEEEIKQEEVVKPFVDNAYGGIEIEPLEQSIQKEEIGVMKKTINLLGSVQGLLGVIGVFILVIVFIDTLKTIQTLSSSTSILDSIYLIVLLTLLLTLSIITYKNYLQMKSIKDAKEMQEFFTQQKNEPDERLIKTTLNLLKTYSKSENDQLKQKALVLEQRIKNSHNYKRFIKS